MRTKRASRATEICSGFGKKTGEVGRRGRRREEKGVRRRHCHLRRVRRISVEGTNSTRRSLKKYGGQCLATNPIDRCWRCRSDWANDRKRLADCALGFGHKTTGGKMGKFYVVTDPSDDDLMNPKPGTLRHAVIQEEPLWIIFSRSMVIKLSQEMMMASHKTIDGRGVNVHITGGAGITIQFVQNIIIHGLHIHDIVPGNGGMIRDSVNHAGDERVNERERDAQRQEEAQNHRSPLPPPPTVCIFAPIGFDF